MATFVVPDDQCKRSGICDRWLYAGNPLDVDLVLRPSTAALAGFVERVFALGDHALEPELLHDPISSAGVASMLSDNDTAVAFRASGFIMSLSTSRRLESGSLSRLIPHRTTMLVLASDDVEAD